ncbi:MAG: helix-turn-helix domain-containing protein [Demequina sp.]|nr:helix-turn-helix domain-containing protein [Demequina sp.]
MRNATLSETALVEDAFNSVRALLPSRWTITYTAPEGREAPLADYIASLVAPNGLRIRLAVEVKRTRASTVSAVLGQLRAIQTHNDLPVLLATDYAPPALRAKLDAEGFSYADATGWVRLVVSDPPILLTAQGAETVPGPPRESAVRRLNGVATNRTICALADTTGPVGVRDLAGVAGVSPGSVSKLLQTLASEGTVDRGAEGSIATVRKRSLVRRWALDYSFAKTNLDCSYFIAPRGVNRALERLQDVETPIALTGSAGARRLVPGNVTPVVPLFLLAVYAASPRRLAAELGLVETRQATAQVMIAIPQVPDILAEPQGNPAVAPTALVVADLLTLPGRGDAEAEQLMEMLARSDPAWSE